MMQQKPIDKSYLISSLRGFDENILQKKYNLKQSNQSVLNKISENDDGILLFDGKAIVGSEGNGINGKSAYDIAVDNGFTGTENEWLESLKGQPGEKGNDGKSIVSITKNNNDYLIVTFSDGSYDTIGKISFDIQADFLTQNGFGNLRYYNNTLQYYNIATSTWIDIEAITDNQLIVQLSPNPMKKMTLIADVENNCYKIVFKEPEDTILNGQLLSVIEGIKFVRKLGSEPENIQDGTLVLDYKRRQFGSYEYKTYLDTGFTPNNGENWFYKAFPYSSSGFISNSSMNVANKIFRNYYLYGFKIDQNESDPSSMISYLEDCDNVYFQSAYMDYELDSFNYGDWKDAWFIKNLKPCMLNYNGTVAYELDPNDYTKKKDGSDSDVTNESFAGNAMIGVPKVYWKIVDNGNGTANIYFSNKKIDNSFRCWSHIDNNGNEIDYCYISIYDCSKINNIARSLSDLSDNTLLSNCTESVEVNYAKANNITNDIIWYTEVFSDITMINLLLLLIGKSTNTQKIFGEGNHSGYVSSTNNGLLKPGTMNKKGLFYGSNDGKLGVKIFGIENYWGNLYRRIAGYINDHGIQKVKMTYGQFDGSMVNGYNFNGNGYITIPNSSINTNNMSTYLYISKMLFNEHGLFPVEAKGSKTTYYCDSVYFNNKDTYYVFFSNSPNFIKNASAGAFNFFFAWENNTTFIYTGIHISCKPFAQTGGDS